MTLTTDESEVVKDPWANRKYQFFENRKRNGMDQREARIVCGQTHFPGERKHRLVSRTALGEYGVPLSNPVSIHLYLLHMTWEILNLLPIKESFKKMYVLMNTIKAYCGGWINIITRCCCKHPVLSSCFYTQLPARFSREDGHRGGHQGARGRRPDAHFLFGCPLTGLALDKEEYCSPNKAPKIQCQLLFLLIPENFLQCLILMTQTLLRKTSLWGHPAAIEKYSSAHKEAYIPWPSKGNQSHMHIYHALLLGSICPEGSCNWGCVLPHSILLRQLSFVMTSAGPQDVRNTRRNPWM